MSLVCLTSVDEEGVRGPFTLLLSWEVNKALRGPFGSSGLPSVGTSGHGSCHGSVSTLGGRYLSLTSDRSCMTRGRRTCRNRIRTSVTLLLILSQRREFIE